MKTKQITPPPPPPLHVSKLGLSIIVRVFPFFGAKRPLQLTLSDRLSRMPETAVSSLSFYRSFEQLFLFTQIVHSTFKYDDSLKKKLGCDELICLIDKTTLYVEKLKGLKICNKFVTERRKV